jgi:hypothetical protein
MALIPLCDEAIGVAQKQILRVKVKKAGVSGEHATRLHGGWQVLELTCLQPGKVVTGYVGMTLDFVRGKTQELASLGELFTDLQEDAVGNQARIRTIPVVPPRSLRGALIRIRHIGRGRRAHPHVTVPMTLVIIDFGRRRGNLGDEGLCRLSPRQVGGVPLVRWLRSLVDLLHELGRGFRPAKPSKERDRVEPEEAGVVAQEAAGLHRRGEGLKIIGFECLEEGEPDRSGLNSLFQADVAACPCLPELFTNRLHAEKKHHRPTLLPAR